MNSPSSLGALPRIALLAITRQGVALAARHFLRRYAAPPPCRFDVVAIEGGRIEWLQAAFHAP